MDIETQRPATLPDGAAGAKAGSRDRKAPSRGAAVLDLQARALMHERFPAAAAAVVDRLALQVGCERVSLGLRVGGRLKIVAVSGASDWQARQDLVRQLSDAMQEALEQRSAIVHPMAADASHLVTRAHGDLGRANDGAAIYTTLVATRHDVLGAMLFERRVGFDAAALQAARDAAMFVGPVLALQHRAQAGVAPRLGRWFGGNRTTPAGGADTRWRAPAAVTAVALSALALWPGTQRVVAPARVEGAAQHVVAAPADGFIGSVAVRPGASVRAGDVLATLDDREIALERDKWAAEIALLDKQYREALSLGDAAPIVTAHAKLEQARSQHALAVRQLDRATLRAPIDGMLISGDLSQSVGMPVHRGQELMTVATAASHRVVAEVDEQDVAALRVGQPAQVLFGALPGAAVPLNVTRIAPVAAQVDGRNVFEVEGSPAAGSDGLRPGMRGVARIEVGERALAVIWWERAAAALRRLSWRLLG